MLPTRFWDHADTRILVIVLTALPALTCGGGGGAESKNHNAGSEQVESKSPTTWSSVKNYGPTSPECVLASDVMRSVTRVGLQITRQGADQAEVDAGFNKVNQLPDGIRPVAERANQVAQSMVGNHA